MVIKFWDQFLDIAAVVQHILPSVGNAVEQAVCMIKMATLHTSFPLLLCLSPAVSNIENVLCSASQGPYVPDIGIVSCGAFS